MSQPAIEISHLSKKYDGFTAVDRLDLSIEPGQIFGYLGPNGSGKTTTILMLLGLTEPTAGSARVFGFDPTREPLKVKRIAGYLPENVGFYDDLSARENLLFIAELNRIPRRKAADNIKGVLAQVGLSEVVDKKVGQFSRGMRQRLGIAEVLLKEPRVVFLDEPTLGLDPQGAIQVLELVSAMSRERGITVLLSSHLLHQVQQICHRVGIISRGKLVAEGTIASLREKISGGKMRVELQVAPAQPFLVEKLRAVKGVKGVETSGDAWVLHCDMDARAEIARTVLESGISLLSMRTTDLALEDIYLKYFQQQ